MSSVVFFHGFSLGPESLDPVLEGLPPIPLVRAPILAGHGSPPRAPEVHDFEAEVDRLADLLPDTPPLLVGYSLGGRLAFGLLLRHPKRVRAAVLVSTQPGLDDPAERAERREADERWAALLEREGLEAFIARWEDQPLFDTQTALPPGRREALTAERRRHTAEGLARSLRVTGLGSMPSYWPRLGSIETPVEILAGSADSRFCALGQAIVETLPTAKLTVVPDAGHNLFLERPGEVKKAILRGLSP